VISDWESKCLGVAVTCKLRTAASVKDFNRAGGRRCSIIHDALAWHQVDEAVVHDDCRGVRHWPREGLNCKPTVRLGVVSLALISCLVFTDLTSASDDEPITHQSQWRVEPSNAHALAIVDGHVGINAETFFKGSLLKGSARASTNHVNSRVRRLCRGEIVWDCALSLIEFERLFAESLSLEVEEVDFVGSRANIEDTVLILMAVARADSDDGGVQVVAYVQQLLWRLATTLVWRLLT
jgi:hypothetical protein